MRLELTPTADYPSFAAVLGLRSTLKALAATLNVLFVGGHHVAKLNTQLKTLGTAVAGAASPRSNATAKAQRSRAPSCSAD